MVEFVVASRAFPENFRSRRGYELPQAKIKSIPGREVVRLLAQKTQQRWLIEHEVGWASIDRVWREIDRFAADSLRESYQCKASTRFMRMKIVRNDVFETAREIGVRRIYDLPIAYWQAVRRLLEEEAQRYPEWEPTLGGTRGFRRKAGAQVAGDSNWRSS